MTRLNKLNKMLNVLLVGLMFVSQTGIMEVKAITTGDTIESSTMMSSEQTTGTQHIIDSEFNYQEDEKQEDNLQDNLVSDETQTTETSNLANDSPSDEQNKEVIEEEIKKLSETKEELKKNSSMKDTTTKAEGEMIGLSPGISESQGTREHLFYYQLNINGSNPNSHTAVIEIGAAEYIDGDSIIPTVMEGINYHIELIEGNYQIVIEYPGNLDEPGMGAEYPVRFNLQQGIVPDNYKINIKATLYEAAEEINQEVIQLEAHVSNPSLSKSIKSSSNSWSGAGTTSIMYGGLDDGEKLSDNLAELELIQFRFSYDFKDRYQEKVVITDTLPDYAEFIAEENEGWEYDEINNAVTYIVEGDNILKGEVFINLKFPNAPVGTKFKNTGSVTGTPLNKPDYEEGRNTETSSGDFLFERYKHGQKFDKSRVGNTVIKNDTTSTQNISQEHYFNISYSETISTTGNIEVPETALRNIEIIDYDLDKGNAGNGKILYYSSVEATNVPEETVLTVIGVTEDNTEIVLTDTLLAGGKFEITDGTKYKNLIVKTNKEISLPYNQNSFDINIGVKFTQEDTPYDLESITDKLENYANIKVTDENQEDVYIYSGNQVNDFYTLADKETPRFYIGKNSIGTSQTLLPGEEAEYHIFIDHTKSQDEDRDIEYEVVDFIPEGMKFVELTKKSNDIDVSYEIVDDYLSSGKTAIIYTVKFNESSKIPSISFDYKLKVTESTEDGINKNLAYAYEKNGYNIVTSSLTDDLYDVNGNGDTGKDKFVSFKSSDVLVAPVKTVLFEKKIKGSLNSSYLTSPAIGKTSKNKEFSYQLSVLNKIGYNINNIVMIDNLPYKDDSLTTGAGESRGSEFDFILSEELDYPDGVKVYYSTERFIGATALKEAANDPSWQESVSDFSQIKSIKVVVEEELAEGATKTVVVKGKPSEEAEYGQLQTNSYAGSYNEHEFVESNPISVKLTGYGSVELEKIDSLTKLPLSEVKFDLLDENDTVIESNLTTDSNGLIRVDNLEVGKYKFIETSALPGYLSLDGPIEFSIKEDEELIKLTVPNEPIKGKLTIQKVDSSDTNKLLSGAIFELYDEEDAAVDRIETVDGKISVKNLNEGNYSLKEIQAPEGYELSEEEIKFTIDFEENREVTLIVPNTKSTGSVLLKKYGEVFEYGKEKPYDTKPLQNVSFDLYKLNSEGAKELVEEGILTNELGEIRKDLPYGSYEFVEKSTLEGYQLDATPIPFEIVGAEEVILPPVLNKLKLGDIGLTKIDGKTKEPLAGAEFKLLDANENEILPSIIYTTGSDGKVEIKGLLPGAYYLHEVKAPDGYQLSDELVEVVVPAETLTMLSDNLLINKVAPITKEMKVTDDLKESVDLYNEEQNEIKVPVTVENTLTPGGVIVNKVDGKTGKSLEGAVFKVLDSEGNAVQEGLVTGRDGRLSVEDLAPGKYQLVETKAPTGYELVSKPVAFEVKVNETSVLHLTVINTLTPGSVIVEKVDDKTSEALEGAVFEIRDHEGIVIRSGLETGRDGRVSIDDLAPGEYQLVETQAPTGYELDSKPVTFTIEKGQKEAVEVSMTNKLTPGGVVLTKSDGKTAEVLSGAVFELQDSEGNVIKSGLVTDASGKLAIDDLAPGEYQLVETQAPTGYELDSKPVTFTIEKGQKEAVEVSMTNKLTPGGVVLTKSDGKTAEVLSGAVFELQDSEGNVIKSGLVTDASGKLAVDDLAPGEYQLVETQAPTGYELDSKP
ncbi:MSCRAMM family protein, partial [Vagococcus xieshaowenii]